MVAEPTADDLTLALLKYYACNKKCVAVDEYARADIVAYTGNSIIEVEIKVCRSDLVNGEKAKAAKHDAYARGEKWRGLIPNTYWVCVPEKLVDSALIMAKALNESYGVIAYRSEASANADYTGVRELPTYIDARWLTKHLWLAKAATKLHETCDEIQGMQIANTASRKLFKARKARYQNAAPTKERDTYETTLCERYVAPRRVGADYTEVMYFTQLQLITPGAVFSPTICTVHYLSAGDARDAAEALADRYGWALLWVGGVTSIDRWMYHPAEGK